MTIDRYYSTLPLTQTVVAFSVLELHHTIFNNITTITFRSRQKRLFVFVIVDLCRFNRNFLHIECFGHLLEKCDFVLVVPKHDELQFDGRR